jgi:hypothetical protein
MEEDRIIAGFHQQVQKASDKYWHDRHIKKKTFKEGYLMLMYENKSIQHLGKLRMNWLGTYEVQIVTGWRICIVERLSKHITQRDYQREATKDVQGQSTTHNLKVTV